MRVFFTGVFPETSELSGAGRHLFKMDPLPTGTSAGLKAEYAFFLPQADYSESLQFGSLGELAQIAGDWPRLREAADRPPAARGVDKLRPY